MTWGRAVGLALVGFLLGALVVWALLSVTEPMTWPVPVRAGVPV